MYRVAAKVLCLALIASVTWAGPVNSVPLPQPGTVSAQAFSKVASEITASPESGLAQADYWEETVDAVDGIATSSHGYPASTPSGCSSQPCAEMISSAHGHVNVYEGLMRAQASGYLGIWQPLDGYGAAGFVMSEGAALINDTITLANPATVTLVGTLTGSMDAFNNDFDNQGNNPRASVALSLSFSRPRNDDDPPCGPEEPCDHVDIGGVNETFDTTVRTTGTVSNGGETVNFPFSVPVDLPAGVSYFNASLVAALDYQSFGYNDRFVEKNAELEFANSLTFEIHLPSGVSATSGSGLLPLFDPNAEPTALQRAQEMKGAGATCTEIAQMLETDFAMRPGPATGILKNVGCTATETAEALKVVFGKGALGTAQLLAAKSYSIPDIAAAMKAVFNASAQAVGNILANIGAAAEAAITALDDLFTLTTGQIVTIMQKAGYAAIPVAKGIKKLFGGTAKGVAKLLKAADYTVEEVATVLKNVFDKTIYGVGEMLHDIGYSLTSVAKGMKKVGGSLSVVVKGIAKFAKSASAKAIMKATKYAFSAEAWIVSKLLKAEGYAAKAIGAGLKWIYNKSAKGSAYLLKSIGFGAAAIANVLQDVYELAKSGAVWILDQIGFGANAIENAICSIFGC